ncbi:hypothetical protein [Micromonospora sp. NPDC093277]|uniref:hypothetical protein n=1 Tax=Micromonospora sp. NPDC093277 TaxID=3364291 RepID=UPI0037FB4D3F
MLDLHEGRPQFRPAGKAGKRQLADRRIPAVLHPLLVTVSGQQAGELSDDKFDEIRRRLTTVMPAPVDRAVILLSWLGRLSIPAEAFWGEGVLVRRLLAELPPLDIAIAADQARTGHAAMGVVNLILHSGDDGTLATAIGPTLRGLFPPAPVTGTSP